MYKIIPLHSFKDERGLLSVIEGGTLTSSDGDEIAFPLYRCFWIKDVPSGHTRGAHAHRTCGELIIAASGFFMVEITDGIHQATIEMESSEPKALYIPPYTWCELHSFSADAICLCMATQSYQSEGYIDNFEKYKEIMANRQ